MIKIFLPNYSFIIIDFSLKAKISDKNVKEINLNELENIETLLNTEHNFYIHTNKKKFVSFTKEKFEIVRGAGGVITNEKNEILFILRNGSWDLPKGKKEKGENKITTAIREVKEETGLKNVSVIKELKKSIYFYKSDSKWVYKIVYWYKMSCSSKQLLIPQKNEGIEKIKWIDAHKLEDILNSTFPSIKDLLLNPNKTFAL